MNSDIKLHKKDLPDEIKFSDKIAIDCEFTGLNIERDRLCLLQISSGKNDAHIIQLDKVRGQEIDVRHILLIPKISEAEMNAAKEEIDRIRERISNGEITFSDAALQFSDEKETRLNGGVIINPSTNDTRFELTKMDPLLYSQVKDLEDNQMSMPLLDNSDNFISKYKILKVTNRFDEHVADFSKDYVKIKDLALTEKQLKTVKRWMEDKINETYVNINSDSDYCSFVYNWKKE